MIDIVFPTYVADIENQEIQHDCFVSFLGTIDRKDFRIIIVDNGSVESAREDARSIADVMVQLNQPVGYAKAVNIGWKLCESETIIVANNDLTFKPGWLEPLLARVDIVTAVAPSEVEFEGESDEIWSSCFMLKRSTRERIGFFDDVHLPYRYHDQDYWIRAKKSAISFKRLGNSIVGHRESTTFRKLPQKDEYIRAEEQIMKDRHGVVMAAHFNS